MILPMIYYIDNIKFDESRQGPLFIALYTMFTLSHRTHHNKMLNLGLSSIASIMRVLFLIFHSSMALMET